MRAVVQRVSRASVMVEGEVIGSIGLGLLVLLGVADGDTDDDAAVIAAKIAGLRLFSDDDGKMNIALDGVGGEILLVSQFTLLADVRKGRRPSFVAAADPGEAARLVEAVATGLRRAGVPVKTGVFGASMEITLVNEGPVTIVIDVVDGSVAS